RAVLTAPLQAPLRPRRTVPARAKHGLGSAHIPAPGGTPGQPPRPPPAALLPGRRLPARMLAGQPPARRPERHARSRTTKGISWANEALQDARPVPIHRPPAFDWRGLTRSVISPRLNRRQIRRIDRMRVMAKPMPTELTTPINLEGNRKM